MSGGSFNYLYCKDADDLLHQRDDLQAMYDELTGLPYATKAAGQTFAVIELLNRFEREAQALLTNDLQEVWKAVEWWKSCDASEDFVRRTIEKQEQP